VFSYSLLLPRPSNGHSAREFHPCGPNGAAVNRRKASWFKTTDLGFDEVHSAVPTSSSEDGHLNCSMLAKIKGTIVNAFMNTTAALPRSEAQKNMRAIQDIGKHAGGSAPPVIHGITTKDVDGHCKTHPVQQ
jgi:hypothetical protein